MTDRNGNDRFWVLALTLPFLVRLYGDGAEGAIQRLTLLALAFGLAYGWAALFAHRTGRPLGAGLPAFAMAFALIPATPVAWGEAVLAVSFGAVFGREIFGGRAILPPALIGLAFAVFSFPEGGFEARGIFAEPANYLFTLSCLPGAALLIWRGVLAWEVGAGAVAGAFAVAFVMGDPAWWEQPLLGVFAAVVLFLTGAPEGAVEGRAGRAVHGILVGGLVVLIRFANPDQPDGVVFAALLGGLFAPLIDRAVGWRPQRG